MLIGAALRPRRVRSIESFGSDNCGREGGRFHCVVDRLPGSIRTTWCMTGNRAIVILLLQYSNQFRLDISGEQDFHFDKWWHAYFLAQHQLCSPAHTVGLYYRFCTVEKPAARMIINTKQRKYRLEAKRYEFCFYKYNMSGQWVIMQTAQTAGLMYTLWGCKLNSNVSTTTVALYKKWSMGAKCLFPIDFYIYTGVNLQPEEPP